MKIVAFGASTSRKSINKQLATYVANCLLGSDINVIDLNDFPAPIFSVDIEKSDGYPDSTYDFIRKIDEADLLIISMAEHNGSYTAAFKNIFDWASRVKVKMFEGKKIFLLSTSTGGRGGIGALEAANSRFPRHGAKIVGSFSLPLFNENFDPENGVKDSQLRLELNNIINKLI